MSGFKGFTEPTKTVKIASGDGELPVTCYGLGLDDLMLLVRDYADSLAPLYEQAAKGGMTHESLFREVVRLIDEMPMAVNVAIALGTRAEPEEMDVISHLTLGAKITLLEAILELTLRSENGSGQVVEIVSRAVTEVRAALRLPRAT
jgi:hypothetical protein